MAHNVIAEAGKCLNCKKPMCVTGCPISTPIPHFISAFLNGRIEDAGKMLFENNPLSLVCSIVCNHANQCQGHCVKGIKGDPIEISTIERFISERYLDSLLPQPVPSNGIKVAVVGSGPAGITIAIKLAGFGYDVTIFESKTDMGGVLRFGIPEFRLPKEIVERYKELMYALGIKIKFNVTIGRTFQIEDLFRDGFRAISVGTGVTWPVPLNVKGETLAHVHYGVHFLERPGKYRLGKSMIVIGGGNVAMDVARTAMRMGVRDVKVVMRSDRCTANIEEREYAGIEGAQFIFNKAPDEICDDGVYFCDTVCDENHRVTSVSNERELMRADTVMICVSQRPSKLILTQTDKIEVDGRGLVKIDGQGETTYPGVFASGDIVRGAKTVVETVETSKRVACAIHEYLQNNYGSAQ